MWRAAVSCLKIVECAYLVGKKWLINNIPNMLTSNTIHLHIYRGGGTSFFEVKLKKFSPSSNQNHENFPFCKPLNSSEA